MDLQWPGGEILKSAEDVFRYRLACLNSFKRLLLEACPCIDEATIAFASDFELPGFPTRKRGILSSMQIAIMKMFSRRAAFLAMFGPSCILSRSTSWHLHGYGVNLCTAVACINTNHLISSLNLPAPSEIPNCALTPHSYSSLSWSLAW